jgi:dihydroorotase
MKTLISGGVLVDPVSRLEAPRRILIENERILDVFPPGAETGLDNETRVIDAAGCMVVPGLIDMHVHLREPGEEYKETVATGLAAAAAGGFTTVACMANTNPVNDNRSVTEWILRQARAASATTLRPIAAMTLGLNGEHLCEYGELAEAGVVAVSDDGRWVKNGQVMRRVLEYAGLFGLTAITHAEDPVLSAGGVMNEGLTATRLGLTGIPAAAEETAIFRDIKLAQLTGQAIHIAHVSTAGSVDIIRRAKSDGLPVTAETAPHYVTLTEEAVTGYDANAKMNPPLRSAIDREALIQGLADGTIDVIASDHAPHSILEKDLEFDRAAFGIVGLETSLALTLELVRQKRLTLIQAVACLSANPARILNIEGGVIAPGKTADLTIIDLDQTWVCDPERFLSKGRNTPFAGRPMTGRAVLTMTRGIMTHNLLD